MGRRIKKLAGALTVVAVALVAIAAFSPAAYAAKKGWAYENGAYYYYENNGTKRTDNWASYNGTWYYLGADGKVVTNDFVPYNGNMYYVGSNGKVVTDSWVYHDGSYYRIGKNGLPQTYTWIKYGNSYYYLDYDGSVRIDGWATYNNNYYYLGNDGKPLVNTTRTIDGMVCYLNESGVLEMWYWDDEPYVTDGYWYNKGGYYFYVPHIDIHSPYADQLNEYLKTFEDLAKEQVANIQAGREPGIMWIDYHTGVYNDNLSIVIIVHHGINNWDEKYVLNIDLATGRQNTTTQILKKRGIGTDDYAFVLYNSVESLWYDTFPESYRALSPSLYDTQRANTLSYDNLANAMLAQWSDGTLEVCVKLYQMAGPSYTYEWIEIYL